MPFAKPVWLLFSASKITLVLQWDHGKEKKVADKRVRMDKDALEQLLFRLFEKQVSCSVF